MKLVTKRAVMPLVMLVLQVVLTACGIPRPASEGPAEDRSVAWFRESGAGPAFVHDNGAGGEFFLPEITGAGCAMLDFDGDGDLDLLLLQGGDVPRGAGPRLYKNLLVEQRRLDFADVTAASGLPATGYGMGVATGDVDNDGWLDLYLTNLGANRLLRNEGGRFRDATTAAGADDTRWSIPALFFDYDRDGWLDLFVGNYLAFSVAGNKDCLTLGGARDYCGPDAYRAQPDRLLRNRGDGTFAEVTLGAGIGGVPAPAMGAVAGDFDADGWPDLFVANDGDANHLWRNRADGTFEEVALLHGAAVGGDGLPQASMGVEAADFDGDGDEDLFLTHLTGEMNALYVNQGGALFQDRAVVAGLGGASKWATGFGVGARDFDLDGDTDLLVVNGAVRMIEEQRRRGEPFPFRQRPQAFRNLGTASFEELRAEDEPMLAEARVGRGLALGDVDNDGDVDALAASNDGPARLLLNRREETSPTHGWLGLRILDAHGRDALGARVGVRIGPGAWVWRRVRTAGSFASASDPRLVVALEGGAGAPDVRVQWVDGEREEWSRLRAGRYWTLRRGEGTEI